MVTRRTIVMTAVALAALAGALPILGQEQSSPARPPDGYTETVIKGLGDILATSHPDVDPAAFLDYYRRTGPDIFAEVRKQLQAGEHDPTPYVRRLADHFRKMERVRKRNPTEYDRLVELEQLESRARILGIRIQQTARSLEQGTAKDQAAAAVTLQKDKQVLRGVLERAFDTSQQNQRIEINRLEAELRAMRRLLDEREIKRDLILQQRFLQLSGERMPPAEKDSVAKSKADEKP